MPPVDLDLLNLSLLIVALLAAAIAAVLLLIEFISRQWLAALGLRACAATWAIVRRLPRKAIWAVALVFSVLAARWLASEVLVPHNQTGTRPTFSVQDDLVAHLEAVTDLGTRMPLYHSRFYGPAAEVSLYTIQLEAEQGQVIRLYDANPVCNCHGWVFTGGEFALRDFDVPTILTEHGYFEVQELQPNDLAVYFDGSHVTHTGLVRLVDASGLIVIESKWGPFGVYLHPPYGQPFAGTCKYFRSHRSDHTLAIHPISSGASDTDSAITRATRRCDESLAP